MLKPEADPDAARARLDALFGGLEDAAGFALAVSGGVDSMALMAMFAVWRSARRDPRKALVLTVDHGLRPEAAAECAMVTETAAKLGLDCRVLRWRPAAGTPVSQASARDGRYRLMASTMGREGLSHLLLGHHRDDQAETVLMRLFSGSGIDGVAGMARTAGREGVTLVRPLLDIPKTDLRQWATDTGIPFADDPTNLDPKYERARLRRLMPEIAAAGGDADVIVRFAGRAARARDGLDATVGMIFSEAASVDRFGVCRIGFAKVAPLHPELRLRLLRRTILAVSGRDEHRLERIERAEAALFEENTAGLTLSACRFSRRGDTLTVTREARNLPRQPRELGAGETVVFDDRFTVAVTPGTDGRLVLAPLGEAGWRDAKTRFPALPAVAEAARAALPGVWRDGTLVAVPGAEESTGIAFAFIAGRRPDREGPEGKSSLTFTR